MHFVYCVWVINFQDFMYLYVGQTCSTFAATLQSYKVGIIILSLIVLVQTGLLVGALVKIVLLTKKGESFANCPNNIRTMS